MFGTVYLKKEKPLIVYLKSPSLTTRLDTALLKNHLQKNFSRVKIRKVIVSNDSIPFDIKSQKWIRMQLDLKEVSVEKEYEINGKVKFIPDSVLVTGPQSILATIDDTLRITVPYKELNNDFDESFSLSYFLHNPYLILSHDKVKVQFTINKKHKENAR